MPPIKVRCPECEAVLKFRVEEGTTAIKCPKCQAKVPVRQRQNPPAPAQAPPPKKTATNTSQAAPPTPKGKKKKKRPAAADNTMRNVIIGVIVVVLVGIGVFLALRPREQAPVAAAPKTVDLSSAAAADFLPADGQMVLRVRLEKLLGELSQFPGVHERIDQQLARLGSRAADPRKIEEVYVVKKADQHFSAIVFSQPLDREAFLADFKSIFTSPPAEPSSSAAPQREIKVEDHNGAQIYHAASDQNFWLFAHPKLLITCTSKPALTAAIDRILKGERSTGFQIGDDSAVSLSVQDPSALLANYSTLSGLGIQSPVASPDSDWSKNIRTARLQMNVTGEGMVGQFVAETSDESAASEISVKLGEQLKQVQGLLTLAQMMGPKPTAKNSAPQSKSDEPPAPLKLTQEGSSVTIDLHLSSSLIQSIASMGGGPAQPSGPPTPASTPSLGETGIPAVP